MTTAVSTLPETLDLSAPSAGPAAADFAACEITGTVRTLRTFDDDAFTIVALDAGRTAIGEAGDDDGELRVGVAYRFFGRWTHHDRHGDQFKFDGFTMAARQTRAGVIAFLARGDMGLTHGDATALWGRYEADAIAMLRDCVSGVIVDLAAANDRADRLYAASVALQANRDDDTRVALFELFATRGIPRAAVRACVVAWGQRAPVVVRRDPFALIVRDIPGVGFRRADKMYLDLGGNPLRLKRQMLAAWHAMHTSSSGNTWESENVLARAILTAAGSMSAAEFDRAIALGVRAKWIAKRIEYDADELAAWLWAPAGSPRPVGETWYAEKANAAAEQRLAKHLRRVMKYRAIWPVVGAADLADDHQRGKLGELAAAPVAILNGSPGVGKTTTAAALIRTMLRNGFNPTRIIVCCPTGKAAVRITEAMRHHRINIQATTIHQALEVDGNTHSGEFRFGRNEDNPLAADVVFVDESSMLSTALAASLFAAIPHGGNVFLLGDIGQLPPVDHGSPLRDMIAAGVPTATLTEIHRNAGGIVRACAAINAGTRFNVAGRVDEAAGANLVHIDAATEEEQLSALVSMLGALHLKGLDPIWDAQVLVLTNEKSSVSRRNVNAVLQGVLNPQSEGVPTAERNPVFRPGDKVICLKNTEVSRWELDPNTADDTGELAAGNFAAYRKTPAMCYVANGDMGRVLAVDAKAAVVQFLTPDRVVRVATTKRRKSEADGGGEDKVQFDAAYAVTIHKSQGSQWPVVIVVIDENAGPLGCKEILYTAISRAERLCFLVGKMPTAWRWSMRASLMRRKTFLCELLTSPST